MIISNTATVREFLSVNGTLEFDNIKSYLRKAERTLLKPLIGAAQLAAFEALNPPTEETNPILKEALLLAQEAVANFGFYLYLPIGAVQITDGGIFVSEGTDRKSATDKQFKELQRSFKTAGHEALDELLTFMELNKASFTPWVESSSYPVYKELLVRDTATFNNYFHIFNSRQTFVAMRPNIKIVEDQFIKGPIGTALLQALKDDQTNEHRKVAKSLLQQSIVAFTIMKTVDNGMFIFDAKGIHMRFDALPYESTITNVNLKPNDQLIHTKRNKETEGENYLKLALDIIKENPDSFQEYTAPEESTVKHIHVTAGVVGI